MSANNAFWTKIALAVIVSAIIGGAAAFTSAKVSISLNTSSIARHEAAISTMGKELSKMGQDVAVIRSWVEEQKRKDGVR